MAAGCHTCGRPGVILSEMADNRWLAERFEEQRPHLRAVAYRMLGSAGEADDALQDAWERVSRAGADDVDNLGGWLTTIVARVCLNALRSRRTRREETLGILPDPIVAVDRGEAAPEDEAVLAESVGLALQVVLDTLSPAERLAFVLHDLFDLPFEEIAAMTGRTSQATRQLASRGRRRVRDAGRLDQERDLTRQRAVVDAFFAAGRAGDLDALIAVLDPDVVLRADYSPGAPARSEVLHGAGEVASQARLGARLGAKVHPVLIDGAAGALVTRSGRAFVLMAFTVSGDRVVEIDVIGDAQRVERLAAAVL